MMLGDFARVKNPELREMGSIRMLNRVLEDTDDQEIKAVGMKVLYDTVGTWFPSWLCVLISPQVERWESVNGGRLPRPLWLLSR